MVQLCGTGHRPQKLPGGFKNKKLHARIKEIIREILTDKNVELVYTGMALGFDIWLAEVALELKIPFVACVPFSGQENIWPSSSRQHYKELYNKAAIRVHVDRQEGYMIPNVHPDVYHPYKMIKRNEYMINQLENNDVLLSLWDNKNGSGTFSTIKYAHSRPITIEHVNIVEPFRFNYPRSIRLVPFITGDIGSPRRDDDDVPF